LEGVDTLGSLLDLSANDLGNELVNELLEIARGSLALDDLEHLRTDLTDLSRLGVGGLLNLVGSALGETNGEETDEVAIGGLDVRVGLDTKLRNRSSELVFSFRCHSFEESVSDLQGLPLANERTKLVRSEVHTVEVGKTVLALNLIDAKLDLSESVLVVLVEIGERKFEDSSLEGVVGVLCSKFKYSSVNQLSFPLALLALPRLRATRNICIGERERYDLLKPEDRLTRVLPTLRVSNMEGALRSYQSE
jgi:hypothetical protein